MTSVSETLKRRLKRIYVGLFENICRELVTLRGEKNWKTRKHPAGDKKEVR
jgi:hypothetical protein